MASTGRIIAIISGCIMFVACIFYIVSNALPRWGSGEIEDGQATVGLWRECLLDGEETKCIQLPLTCLYALPAGLPICNKMLVARTFVTIACIMSALSALCLFVCVIISTASNRSMIIIAKITPFISLIPGIIGVAVGIAFVTSSITYKMNDAAIVGIVALIVNAIGAIVALIIR